MPAVAAISTGVPSSAPASSTSKNDLNSPLYDALNTGVTAITASAAATDATASASAPDGNPVSRLSVIACARSRSSTTSTSAVGAGGLERRDGGRGQLVGQDPRRRWLAQPGGDDDETWSYRHLLGSAAARGDERGVGRARRARAPA